MPAIQPIKLLGAAKFLSHGLKLPVNFKKPTGDPAGKQYSDAIKPEEKVAIPQLIPPWFLPAEVNKYYQDSCDKIGKEFKDLHDDMCDAVAFAHQQWKLLAKFQNIQVMAVSAIGTPGCLDGPELEGLIKTFPKIIPWMGNKAKHRDAIAKGVSKCFKNWQGQVTVPGLPWYPAFAAFPGPQAPPMPNVPTPLIACVSAKVTDIMAPMQMKSEMDSAFDSGLKSKDPDKHFEALHDAVATTLSAEIGRAHV
jgi:hypothetical protein